MDDKLRKLIKLAEEEDWSKIDDEIPKIASAQKYIDWAKDRGVKDNNGNIRDLALSIIEKARLDPNEFMKIEKMLYEEMRTEESPNLKFRAAFALASHGSLKNKKELLGVLRDALRDPDFKDLAENYLDKIK